MDSSAVLDYPVHAAPQEALQQAVHAKLDKGERIHIVTLNPEMLMAGNQNPALGQILKTADIVLPDGLGVVWALGQKGVRVKRIPGIEFSEKLIQHAATHGESIALIGAAPEVNDACNQALLEKYPGLKISYRHHGFFGSAESRQKIAEECAASQPRYVFVALGVPGQEIWIQEFKSLFTGPTCFVGVGGSFDVWSGTKKRAPALFRALQLEWLWRISSEPWRIGRVYKSLPMFVIKVLMER